MLSNIMGMTTLENKDKEGFTKYGSVWSHVQPIYLSIYVYNNWKGNIFIRKSVYGVL